MPFVNEMLIALFSFFLGCVSNSYFIRKQNKHKIQIIKKALRYEIENIMEIVAEYDKNPRGLLKDVLPVKYDQHYNQNLKNIFMLDEKIARDIESFYTHLNTAIKYQSSSDTYEIRGILNLISTGHRGKDLLKKL